MYKNSFSCSCKKNITPFITKIKIISRTLTFNIHTQFEINRMYRLDAIVFTHIHIHTHTHTHIHTYIHTSPRKWHKRIPETSKRINTSKSRGRIFSWLQYFSYIVYVWKVKKHVLRYFFGLPSSFGKLHIYKFSISRLQVIQISKILNIFESMTVINFYFVCL